MYDRIILFIYKHLQNDNPYFTHQVHNILMPFSNGPFWARSGRFFWNLFSNGHSGSALKTKSVFQWALSRSNSFLDSLEIWNLRSVFFLGAQISELELIVFFRLLQQKNGECVWRRSANDERLPIKRQQWRHSIWFTELYDCYWR